MAHRRAEGTFERLLVGLSGQALFLREATQRGTKEEERAVPRRVERHAVQNAFHRFQAVDARFRPSVAPLQQRVENVWRRADAVADVEIACAQHGAQVSMVVVLDILVVVRRVGFAARPPFMLRLKHLDEAIPLAAVAFAQTLPSLDHRLQRRQRRRLGAPLVG
ncbi:hypothetical protein Ae201684_009706 [Aphanomyces euteiches]|uniref:Uncharacterized protein n=1 Tax=Aphanomyces euteiches TaxID=100861 RepID=A0A6G0X0R2_9STRA|nr:hypothetical protein Ae201684_009706 [Aphanomyces euteiches]